MLIQKIKTPQDLKNLSAAELEKYAQDVRSFIVEATHKNGGHLSSNLGAVELTIALHSVFNSPNDKFIFDVGHQAYTHKLITGRYETLKRLRTNQGASGFPSIKESDHDHFTSGHSSNSLSLALGLARARDKLKQNHHIVSIIGDGAFTGGMIYEALNDIGENKSRLIIVLNDNKMSISKNVGGMSKYFAKLRLSRRFSKFRQNVRKTFSVFQIEKHSDKNLDTVKARFKSLFMKNRLFENFGVTYYGPFDGHNIRELCQVFDKVANKSITDDKPVIIHVITQKGKGMTEAENEPDKYHGLGPAVCHPVAHSCHYGLGQSEGKDSHYTPVCHQNTATCHFNTPACHPERSTKYEAEGSHSSENVRAEKSFSQDLADELIELADKDDCIVAITAAMPTGTGLDKFADKHPDKYYDVSIAEQHATTLCAGLAKGGLKPIFCVYSTFLQRAFDQILHDVCLNNLGVVFAIDRAGITGSDGVTHQGIYDLSYLNTIPNLTVLTPKDGAELKGMLGFAFRLGTPVAIRYPKGYFVEKYSNNNHPKSKTNITACHSERGTSTTICHPERSTKCEAEGSSEADFALRLDPSASPQDDKIKKLDDTNTVGTTALGRPNDDYIKWEILQKSVSNIYILACGSRLIELVTNQNLNANIINARCVKPLDHTFLDSINNSKNLIITLEDNISNGGFSSVVLHYLISRNPKIKPLFIPLSHKTAFTDNRCIQDSFQNSNLTINNIKVIIKNFLA